MPSLLTQSYKKFLPQTNNQPRTSSNTRNQATVQDGRVVVQNVQGRLNRIQRTNPRGRGTAGYGGAQNRVGNANPGQGGHIKCYNCNGIGHIARNCTQPKHPQNSDYFKDKMLLIQAQENGVALDEEQLMFLAEDDCVFQANDCDAFDSDVDEAPTAQTMFMANMSSADLIYDEAGLSYDSDILSEVHNHDHYQDVVCEHHEEHEMHDNVQLNHVIDSHADYTSDSNMISYDQYVKDNAVPGVQSNVSFVPNDAYMMIYNDMYEPHAQSIYKTSQNTVVDNIQTAKIATYKEQVELYERRARFKLTEKEQKINKQLRIVITDRNFKEETLKKELYLVKLQLASTINHNKLMVEEVTSLKKDFKQKEDKYLEDFLDMKSLKENVEDILFKQDQSLQTVHMLCRPKSYYNKLNEVVIGYKNPLCLAQDTLEIAEITRKKMNEKMKTPLWTHHKINIRPPNYSKENFLATFTPQTQLTPEQIFWSKDVLKMKTKALKEQAKAAKTIKALTVYPPNTPVKLVPRYQASPTKKHLEALKHVFRYQRGTINWGLWYPKDTAMTLTAYADANHVGCQDTQRNTMADVNVNAPTEQAPTIKHKFHPRPDSPLHLPNEEPGLGYLKFSTNGTKQEVFGMPISIELIIADIQDTEKSGCYNIQGKQYYKEYLEKMAKHQRYLVGEERSDPDSPAPKPAKATKKSKPSAPKADLRTPVTKHASSQQHKPKPAPTNSLRSVDVSVNEGIPEKEPRFDDEKADIQREMEESLKSVHDAPRGLLPPMVIREPDSGKFQPLPGVQGKGKKKVSDEQVARHAESPSIYAALGLTDSDSESDKEVPLVVEVELKMKVRLDQTLVYLLKARLDQTLVMMQRLNLNQVLLFMLDQTLNTWTLRPRMSQIKYTLSKWMKGDLEEPASSTWTLSSLEHLAKDFSFGDLFFNDKPSEAENEKTTAETEVESMVSVTIQQDTSAIPSMTTPVIDLTSRPDSPNVHRPLQATATKTTTTTTTHPPPPQPQQSTTYCMLIKRIGKLEQIMANLIQDSKHQEERLDSHGHIGESRDLLEVDMKEILHQRMWETNSYKTYKDHMMLYEALEKSMSHDHTNELLKDLAEARKKKKKRHDSPKIPPSQSDQSQSTAALSSSKTTASAKYTAWKTTNTRLKPSVSSILEDLHMDDDMAPDEQPLEEDRPATPEPAWSIPSSDLHVLTNNWEYALASTYTLPPENSLLAQTGDMAMFMDWFCKRQGITELKPQDLEGSAFELYQMEECHKLLTNSVEESIIRHNVSKPLPLGGPPGQMKAAYFPDVGLEQMVPDQMWIEEECKYDIAAIIEVFSMYGYDYMKKIVLCREDLNEHIIAKRDFKYLYPSDFEDLYLLNLQGYLNHLPPKDKNILTTAVNLWTRHLVINQSVEDFQLGIESYQTQLNLTKPRLDATGFEYKHDFTVIDSPRAVTFRDKYGVQMIMRFNEIHKFSDGTLHQIDEALDYRVKEFKVNMINSGLNTRFWTRKDVDRSKEFMFAIQKRLKTRRIFRNLESFVGGRVRERDYRLPQQTE
nr:hypothetical protein [Tanacetum cinerariifolium]